MDEKNYDTKYINHDQVDHDKLSGHPTITIKLKIKNNQKCLIVRI